MCFPTAKIPQNSVGNIPTPSVNTQKGEYNLMVSYQTEYRNPLSVGRYRKGATLNTNEEYRFEE